VGLILFLLPKTPRTIVSCLVLIFVLLVHPLWNFWWIEERPRRRSIFPSARTSNDADKCHHGKEEVHLFPFLEKRGVPARGCPMGALLHEHEQGRTLVTQLAQHPGLEILRRELLFDFTQRVGGGCANAGQFLLQLLLPRRQLHERAADAVAAGAWRR